MYPNFSARALGLAISADETLTLASEAGFEGVDLLVRDIVEEGGDLGALKARMEVLGLRGSSWPLPVDWRGEDEGRFARDRERLPHYADAAARLGVLLTGTWVMPETSAQPTSQLDRERVLNECAERHVRRLGAVARVLDRFGVRLGLEVIGVKSTRSGRGVPFVHRLADLDRWLGALWNEAPNLGVIVDGFQLYAAGEKVEAGLAWGVERVVAVHLADLPASASRDRDAMRDNDRGLPGEHGAIDSGGLLARLADLGYHGPVTVEPMPGCRSLAGLDAARAARITATALRAVWPSTCSDRSRPKSP